MVQEAQQLLQKLFDERATELGEVERERQQEILEADQRMSAKEPCLWLDTVKPFFR